MTGLLSEDRRVRGALLALMLCTSSIAIAQGAAPDPPPPPATIVPDSQFEAQLPALDPDINAPLESIDSFAGPSDAAAPPPADAPDDPALTEPLPAIATFDVMTPPANAATEAAEAAPEIKYSVAVEGLKEVKLEGRFRSLSALDNGDGEAANGAVVAARAREDEALALRILKSEGYYDAAATSSVAPTPGKPNRVTATITAAPGARYSLGGITVTGAETAPPGLPRDALVLKPGDPIVASVVEGAEANISLRLPQQGYPFVQVGVRDIVLDDATLPGGYTLPVDPGVRASFGGFTTSGDLAFDASHVGILSRFKQGELYDSRKVDDLREALVATGLFSTVAIEPVKTGAPGPDGTALVDINVIQDAGPPRTLAGNAGYATGEGFKLTGSWTHRNLFKPEGALIVQGVAGTQEQSAGVTFRRSNAGKRDRTVSLAGQAGHEDFDAYEAYTASIIGRISRDSTPIWQKRWTWSYGFELIATDEKRKDPTRVRDDGTYFIAALPAQLGYDRSNSLLDPTKGFRLLGRISPEVSQRAPGGTKPYARALVEGSVYYPAGDSITLAARVRLGSIVGAGRDDIAPSRRLYSGGGGSVRGFGYQELGPRDALNNPIGGRSLTEFAVEARYRFGNYGIVPFIDGGQIYENSYPGFSDLRFGAGIGGRLYTNFGPLRVDVATPLGRRKGEAKVALYISIGQAF